MNTESREPVLRCQGVDKSYRQGSQLVKVLGDVNCAIAAGELVAIVGSSGSGKSTLLNLMGGLDDPDRGEIHVNGQLLQPLSESRRARWRNAHLGFVYQFHHLLGEFTALENVAIPNLIGGKGHGEANAIARGLLERVGLGERIGHRPAALSGGERQRVAIARALATSPSCVLMDEPTGNLDPTTAATVLNLLLELNRDLGISFVIVTHDMSIAARMDRILRLDGGRLEAAVA
ncbi:MAG: ATP-binding cassette domain-containing protein [Porticoccaceae bacterium]|jgi:lipoprotein-releasing system ATP-binding protein|nr:ATP-binding cassette domain-containing protein [Porticoccaceae bacterium]MEA3300494.1 ATP-binding cassette domain-containing protein [Pseudomonadota bacterium]